MRSPRAPSSPGWTSQLSQPLITGEVLRSPEHLGGPPLGSSQYVQVSLLLGDPDLGTELQVRPHQRRAEGSEHLSGPAGDALPNAAQIPLTFLAARPRCWLVLPMGLWQSSLLKCSLTLSSSTKERAIFLFVILISANNYLSMSATRNEGKTSLKKLLISLEKRDFLENWVKLKLKNEANWTGCVVVRLLK